jgi:hypothetical protein
VTCALLWFSPFCARADNMDLALSRLRIVGGKAGCPVSAAGFCPDQELFERLVSELAVSMAPPVSSPARSVGPRALALSLDTTITSIEAQQSYWVLGTEGSGGGDPQAGNAAPQSALVWNRVQARKGLPFGLEAGASLGQGLNTSLFALGLALKWALFEGFRTGLGRLPDVSVAGSVNRSVGSSQASVQLYAIDLTLSKPFVIEHTWSLSPFGGIQTLFTSVHSGVIDLTPAGPGKPPDPSKDAFNACSPRPGEAPGPTGCAAGGDASDFHNDVVFKPVTQTRVRMFLGGQARYQLFTLSLSWLFDLSAPTVEAPLYPHIHSNSVARQVAFNVALGVVL